MNKALQNYECDGQLSIFDIQEPVYELDIRGFMDDPYCPQCDYAFITYGANDERDCERCPNCHVKVDWGRWHRINDEEDN